ncbi:MAG: hypothetical protein CVV64_17770 [Candidatus Wallbacteria bacterium HGW-Wallbacteria-1]|jgi:voltage-gated potassium channel|uniref:Potassium channel protein n=1 Tax=Candidatus Wallbacteria bacterium HGW-Wallbacteria-1 TaxID=2013854 RepID=A0A2N1PK32_9BACT|nr:MAG: hypothetical protein CVV64_17770 [Candidatus Wallbacteria bacterium HGW-Wallbacteria-1]
MANFGETRKGLVISMLLLALMLACGIAGYMALEGLNLTDSIYTTVIVLSTVGMGEVREFTPNGRLFTVFLILSGAGLVGFLISQMARFVLGGELDRILRKGQSIKMIRKLNDHVIICGAGVQGTSVLEEFQSRNYPYVVIEKQPEIVTLLASRGVPVLEGDATDDDTLIKANIATAKGLISCMPTDVDNVFVCLSARNLNQRLNIVTKADMDSSVEKLNKAGANRVISTKTIGSRRMVAAMMEPSVIDFLDIVMTSGKLDLRMADVVIQEGSAMVGGDIVTLGIRRDTGCIILAVRRGSTYTLSFGTDFLFQPDDVLIALGTSSQLKRLEKLTARSS